MDIDLRDWLPVFFTGFVVTLELVGATLLFTIPMAGIISVSRICPSTVLRVVALGYVDLFRSIPLLALLTFVYYGLGRIVVGVPTFWLGVACVGLNSSAYLAEVYRGGLQSLPSSQWEAASSLGLSWTQTMRRVIVPQAILPAIPGTVNAFVFIVKDSSLVSLITVAEITLQASQLVSETFLPLQIYVILAGWYLVLTIPATLLGGRLEARVRASLPAS